MGYSFMGPHPKGADFCGYILEKVQTETRAAFSALGSGTRSMEPKTYKKKILGREEQSIAWSYKNRYLRITERQRFTCRAGNRISKNPTIKMCRGIDLPNKTIKMGCKAWVRAYVFEVLDDLYTYHNPADLRKENNDDLVSSSEIIYGIQIYPVHTLHEPCGHLQSPHPEVVDIIKNNGYKCQNLWRLRGILEEEVSNLLEQKGYTIHLDNRMWFPTVSDIRNCCASTGLEVDRLEDLVEKFRSSGDSVEYIYEPDKEVKTNTKFMLVYQNEAMKSILKDHGDYLFLDSTHKTNKYKMPLFQLMVFTPHGYQVVAVFLTSKLDGDTVAEALHVVKRWNPDLSPTYSMTDIDTAEINAIQEVFPGTKHFYCDFHIKQAWEKAIKNHFKSDDIDKEIVGDQYNNAEAKITAYQLLLYLMDADCPWSHHLTETLDSDFEARLLRAANHPVVLRNPGFRNYLISWSSPIERSRWAKPYRDNSAIRGIFTNNGVEALNGVLKNRVMNNSSKQGVPSLLQALVYDYLPTKQTMYRHKRMAESAAYKRILVSNDEAHFQWPFWMNGIPHKSLLRIKENYKRSVTFGGNDILTKENYYIIRTKDFSIEDNQSYHAYKVTVSPSVHCDCLNFRSYPELPCKHLLAVIRETNVEWADLPLSFRHNPHLCADPDPGASCSTEEVPAVQLDDGTPYSNLPTEKSTEGDLNATFGKLADLRSMIYNVAPENRREMRDLVSSVIDGMLLPRLSEMTKVDMTVTATRDTDGLSLSTTSRGQKRTDFSDSLPKPAKKKRKQFAVRKPNYGFESDSDFEN